MDQFRKNCIKYGNVPEVEETIRARNTLFEFGMDRAAFTLTRRLKRIFSLLNKGASGHEREMVNSN